MKRIGSALIACVALLAAPLRAQDQPIQHFVMVEAQDGVDLLAIDRWYITYHAPETLARADNRQTRYVSFRTYGVTPEEARQLNMVHGRLTEIGFASVAAFRAGVTPEAMAAHPPTPPDPAVARGLKTQTVTVKLPPDKLKDGETPDKAVPYVRWVAFVRAPDGVTDADAWVRQTFAAPLADARQSRRVEIYPAAIPRAYSHVVVAWYDDVASWRDAMQAFAETRPKTGAEGGYPATQMRSILVGERPDLDFRTDKRVTP